MNSNTAAIPDTSTNIGGTSLSGIRSRQDQSRSHKCTRSSIHVVRRIPDEAVVVPCSATLVHVSEDIVSEDVDVCCEESEIGVDMSVVPSLSAGLEIVSEQLTSEDMDECEESEIVVDIPVVVPSAALKSDYEEIATGGVDVCEESDVVDIPTVVPCAEPLSISDETTTNMDVCQKSESDGGLPGVAHFDPLQTALGKEFVFSEPTIFPVDTEPEVAMLLPEVGLEEQAIKIRVGLESGKTAGVLAGRVHDEILREEVFVDGATGCSAGVKVMDASTQDFPAMFASLDLECDPLSLGPLLAAPD